MREAVILINPGQDRGGEQQHLSPHRIHRDIPPISILTLGSYRERQGVLVVLYAAHTEQNYADTIEQLFKHIRIILMGMMIYVGRFIPNAFALGSIIEKVFPEVPSVWGGPVVSALPESTLREGNAELLRAKRLYL